MIQNSVNDILKYFNQIKHECKFVDELFIQKLVEIHILSSTLKKVMNLYKNKTNNNINSSLKILQKYYNEIKNDKEDIDMNEILKLEKIQKRFMIDTQEMYNELNNNEINSNIENITKNFNESDESDESLDSDESDESLDSDDSDSSIDSESLS